MESSGLSDTVGSNQTQYLAWAGSGQSMEFEGVSAVSVSDLRFKSLGQVDDLDGFEWTLLDAHATANTQVFRNKANR